MEFKQTQTSQLSWFGRETRGFKAILTVSRSTANFSLSFTGTHGFGHLINNFTRHFNFIALINSDVCFML